MGKGIIISGGTDGQYSVRVVYNTDRAQAEKTANLAKIANLETQIAEETDGQKLNILKLQKLSLEKRNETLDAIPETFDTSAWCADLTEDLSGEVGLIEVPGESQYFNIQPGYGNNAVYSPSRDGQLTPTMAMSSAAAFYNLAMLPGWQKWKPTYRYGTITAIDGDMADVALQEAVSTQQGLGVNQETTLSNVGINYMDCNARAFEVGDEVLVKFTGQEWNSPEIVGFVSNPKECADVFNVSAVYTCSSGTDYNQHISPSGVEFRCVSANYHHSAGVDRQGNCYCWGRNDEGQCNVPSGYRFKSVACGIWCTVGLTTDGELLAWGSNDEGLLSVPAGDDFASVHIGIPDYVYRDGWDYQDVYRNFALALKSDGTCVGWGDNTWGQASPPALAFKQVDPGAQCALGILMNGSLIRWGRPTIDLAIPGPHPDTDHYFLGPAINAPESGAYKHVAMGPGFGAAIKEDGGIRIWWNQHGIGASPSGVEFVNWTYDRDWSGPYVSCCFDNIQRSWDNRPSHGGLVYDSYDVVTSYTHYPCLLWPMLYAVRDDGVVERWRLRNEADETFYPDIEYWSIDNRHIGRYYKKAIRGTYHTFLLY
jgi:hypothetical protein